MLKKIEICRVIVPIPCGDQESKRFYEEARRIFLNNTQGVPLEVLSPCGTRQVEVIYRFPIEDGDPLIPMEVETSEVFKDLTKFKDFLETAVV